MKHQVKKLNSTDDLLSGLIANAILSHEVYDAVLKMCDIVMEDDVIYWRMMLGILKRQTLDHIVITIWSALSEDQAVHLRDYLAQNKVVSPLKTHEEGILEFAQLYPDLRLKVDQSLEAFFKMFVARYQEITEA